MASSVNKSANTAAKPARRLRLFRFSLRTLLIFMTVLSVFMAVGLRWVAPAQRQRMGVKQIENIGGRCIYTDRPANETWLVTTLREWLPRDYFDSVWAVYVSDTSAPDLVVLGSFPQVKRISLSNTTLTDAALLQLPRLKQLEELMLDRTRITDAGLAHLAGRTQLQWLELDQTQITDAGLRHLVNMTQLRGLILNLTQSPHPLVKISGQHATSGKSCAVRPHPDPLPEYRERENAAG